jgi:hypothetical protein
MTVIALLVQILTLAANAVTPLLSSNQDAAAADKAATALLSIVQAAMTAHQQLTGQPIDPALLQPIEPVE